MNQRTVPDLKELFKQASEIAQQVPESMQDAAFNRAIDLLTGDTQPESLAERKSYKNKGKKKAPAHTETKSAKSPANKLLSEINSTQHPGIKSPSKVLDRSLIVLQIALRDHNIDGLVPSDISKILTEKFRIRTTHNAVSMALAKATDLVDRIPKDQGFAYRIMGPGEEHIARLGESEDTTSGSTKRRKKKIKRPIKKVKNVSPALEDSSKKNAHKIKQKKSLNKAGQNSSTKGIAGPKAMVLELIESGFFSKGRTGPEVQNHLKNKRGFNFGTAQLRLVMLRLVRDKKLERDENAEGQYEYKRSKA